MYEAPQVSDLGSVEEMTADQPGNKVGSAHDMFSQIVPLIGSVGPVQSR